MMMHFYMRTNRGTERGGSPAPQPPKQGWHGLNPAGWLRPAPGRVAMRLAHPHSHLCTFACLTSSKRPIFPSIHPSLLLCLSPAFADVCLASHSALVHVPSCYQKCSCMNILWWASLSLFYLNAVNFWWWWHVSLLVSKVRASWVWPQSGPGQAFFPWRK